MKDFLTQSELMFLASQSLEPDDVYDARDLPQSYWMKDIEFENKTVALGSRCKKAGHRLRSRRGHCVQCDTRKLAFQARFGANQYVYIAGSRSGGFIKIGTCRDCEQRERQMRSEQYGGANDWQIVFTIKVRNAGSVEHSAHARLCKYGIARPYWKDGFKQNGIELLQCSFSQAVVVLLQAAANFQLGTPWQSSYSSDYEFAYPR